MNEGNFLKRLSGIISGSRFLREKELSLHGHVRASDDYLPLVTGDAPTWVEGGIQFDDGETAFLDFDIPQDYDVGIDACALRLHLVPSADAAHTTDMGITTAQSIYRAGAAVDATASTAVAETATASTGVLVRESVLDISSRGYQPGDRIRLTLDANNSGTTELILLGI
ncbi:hypothetical protein KKE60_07885, partial [Patescibacteria group bacterium]|nr:hypothetical protein [Patescibacteria group bacterium]